MDLDRLDYPLRTRPIRGQAIMRGVTSAVVVYGIAFALGYYGWAQGAVSHDQFSDFVWIMMVPASAVGALAGLISKNRLEYPVREDIKGYIRELEGGGGWLWRYGPLLEAVAPGDAVQQSLIRHSREGRIEELTPEDYPRVVRRIEVAIGASTDPAVTEDVLGEVEQNLDERR